MDVQVTTLANGIRIATGHMPWVNTISFGVWYHVGARNESLADNGISHMLEHMAFKGTKKRSALDIAEEFDAIGGNLNAYTSMEQTVYYAKILSEDLGKATDILGDILKNSVFDPEEVERERMVILQEIAMHHDTPEDLVYDYFTEATFKDQSIGYSVLGSPENVSRFNSDDMRRYVDTHYHASRMVCVATGKVDHDDFVQKMSVIFEDTTDKAAPAFEKGSYTDGYNCQSLPFEQSHLLMGWKGFSNSDKDYRAAQLLSTVLGGGMSSRLFQEIRERRGLVYNIYSFPSSYSDCGLFGISAATSESKLPELLKATAGEMERLTQKITEEELQRAKVQIRAGMLMSEESTTSQAEVIGRHLVNYGRYIPVQDILAEIDAIDAGYLTKLAERIMRESKPTLAVVGPIKTLPEKDAFCEMFAA